MLRWVLQVPALALAVVLGSGCAFEAGGPAGGEDDGAGVDGGFAATPAPDAGPVPPPPVLLETLSVSFSGSSVDSETVLEEGTSYLLRARGVGEWSDGWKGDAEYFWNQEAPSLPGDSWDGVDIGLAIDDDAEDDERVLRWGDYDEVHHRYEVTYVGRGEPLRAELHDSGSSDGDSDESGGSGELMLEIHGPPPPGVIAN